VTIRYTILGCKSLGTVVKRFQCKVSLSKYNIKYYLILFPYKI